MTMTLRQGDCIQLSQEGEPAAHTYQVIAIDAGHDRCWLRRWPMGRQGSPVQEFSLQQVHRRSRHCPSAPARHPEA